MFQRAEVRLNNLGEFLKISYFFRNFNNLSACREVLRGTAIVQQIAHGPRMIRTRRASVKADLREKIGFRDWTG